jgi:hypothetical protein
MRKSKKQYELEHGIEVKKEIEEVETNLEKSDIEKSKTEIEKEKAEKEKAEKEKNKKLSKAEREKLEKQEKERQEREEREKLERLEKERIRKEQEMLARQMEEQNDPPEYAHMKYIIESIEEHENRFLEIINEIFEINSPHMTIKIGFLYLAHILEYYPKLAEKYIKILIELKHNTIRDDILNTDDPGKEYI